MLPQALTFFEAILLHDLMGHRTSVEAVREKKMDHLKSGIDLNTNAELPLLRNHFSGPFQAIFVTIQDSTCSQTVI